MSDSLTVRDRARLTVAAALFSVSAAAPAAAQLETAAAVAVGGRVDWYVPGNLVAIDRLGQPDGRSDVYIMRPNGAEMRCLTCPPAAVPQGHNGNPAWHPSGSVLVFQAQNPELAVLPAEWEAIRELATSPGWGLNHNLWLAMADGSRFWQLTNVAAGMAVLHPHFDASGMRLVWAEKVAISTPSSERWVMKIANLRWSDGVPALINVRVLAPLGPELFYEAHAFSSDGKQLLFSAGRPAESSLDIYLLDLIAGTVRNLTNSPGEYDEHAQFTPDGTSIVWASSRDITIPRDYFVPYLDYWKMRVDGTDHRRVTSFNQPGAREYYPNGIVVGDLTFGPDGWMMAKVEVGGIDPTIKVVEIIVALREAPPIP
jgi:hypothetical protein